MKRLSLALLLLLCSGSTNLISLDCDRFLVEMKLWLKHPELHPDVEKATKCRRAIKNMTASLECQAVAKYLDICKEPGTKLDSYHRSLRAAEYNLTLEESQKYHEVLLQIHKGNFDNSNGEEVAVLVKAEKMSDPDIVELAKSLQYFLLYRNSSYKDLEKINKMRRYLEEKMKIEKNRFE